MILKENDINDRNLARFIGKPTKVDFRKPKPVGSTTYYLKSFKSKEGISESIALNSRCIFEKFSEGVLLRANSSNFQSALPIPEKEIIKIVVTKGEEKISPYVLSPMWILLKAGVPIRYARYFRITVYEYTTDQMTLSVITDKYEMKFIANGYSFEQQWPFLEGWDYGNKIVFEPNLYKKETII